MKPRAIFALALAPLVVCLALAAPAFSYGPTHEEGQPAFEACDGDGGLVDRQVDAGIQAGGGPKSVDVAPTNCDHFWQDPAGAGVIGNGWPPPHFAP